MNILIVAPHFPFYDRASGDLRFMQMVQALATEHRIWFCAIFERAHAAKIGEAENQRYCRMLEEMGVVVSREGPRAVMREVALDAIFFEFYFAALPWLDDARLLSPDAHVLVDSVDVHFHRLNAKARLTGAAADAAEAADIKTRELLAYEGADLVVVVTDEDGRLLAEQAPQTRLATIANIHPMHPPVPRATDKVLTFVGGFAHEPNTDAVLWFAGEILPLVRAAHPDVVVNIIGNAPPPEVQALANDTLHVLGYVPQTDPYLRSSLVSIAPLRYGAGMKGKIGEAMSHGLPVVTTSCGVEGFGLTNEENVLVGDNAADFARQVIRLIDDAALHARIGRAGWDFIDSRYSDRVVKQRVLELFRGLDAAPIKRMAWTTRMRRKLARVLGRLRAGS